MAGGFLQGTGASNASSAAARNLSFTNTTVTGSLIVVGVISEGTGNPTCAVTDNKGNGTYTALTAVTSASGPYRVQIHYKKNAAGGASHQITVTPSGAAFVSLAIAEFSGAATTGTQDGQNTGQATGTNAATGSVTVTGGNSDILFGFMGHNSGTTTLTPGSGFSQVAEVESNTNMPFNAEYKLGVTASQTCAWTNASVDYGCAGASFAEAVAAAFGPPPYRRPWRAFRRAG